jgi:hypothetical protein
MIKKDIEDGLKNIFDSMEKLQDDEHFDDANHLKDQLDINDPESYFFTKSYHSSVTQKLALKLKLKELNPKNVINPRYDKIYFNYNKVETFISGLIKDFEGFSCSTDKARHIVHTIMKRNFYVNKSNKYKINNNGYWTPKYRNTNDWEILIFSFLNISNQSSIEQLLGITLKIKNNYKKVQENRSQFYSKFYNEIIKNDKLCNIPILDIKKNKLTINEYIKMINDKHSSSKELENINYHLSVVYYLKKIEPTAIKEIRNSLINTNVFISF